MASRNALPLNSWIPMSLVVHALARLLHYLSFSLGKLLQLSSADESAYLGGSILLLLPRLCAGILTACVA